MAEPESNQAARIAPADVHGWMNFIRSGARLEPAPSPLEGIDPAQKVATAPSSNATPTVQPHWIETFHSALDMFQ
jgi:hypothetical protein